MKTSTTRTLSKKCDKNKATTRTTVQLLKVKFTF